MEVTAQFHDPATLLRRK